MVDENDQAASEFGWRVHGALEAWTAKVDAKASIALAVEAAAIGFALSLTEASRALAGFANGPRGVAIAGFALLAASSLAALAVVFPQLKSRVTSKNWQ